MCTNSLDEMINLRCKMVTINAMVFEIFHFEVQNPTNWRVMLMLLLFFFSDNLKKRRFIY